MADTVTKVYAVEDCKIYKLLTDPAAGSATYGTEIDVPGIKSLEISGNVDTKELRGDNQLLDSNSTLTNITVAVSHAKISMDALAVILGGDHTSGTFTLAGTDSMSYFAIEAKTPTGGGDDPAGDVHFRLNKCILSSFPSMGLSEEDYRIMSFEARAVPRISDQEWLTITKNTTAVALSGS